MNAAAKAHGGARDGAGRPAGGMQRVNVILDAETIAILRAAGDGNLSAGIRIAAQRIDKRT